MLNKAQIRTSIRQYMDDPAAKRWDNSSLDLAIQFVLDDLWGEMLDVAPYLTSMYQQLSVPIHTPGYIDLRLTTYGGDLVQRFYRLQQLVANGRHYFAKDPRDYLLTASTNTGDTSTIKEDVAQSYSYQFLGDQLWLHPLQVGTQIASTFVEMRYSFKPIAFTQIADGNVVPFPEGHEQSLILISAASALAKGNAEEAGQLFAMGNNSKERMISAIKRQYHGPTVPFTTSQSGEWGGA